MVFRRFADLLTKPVLVVIPPGPTTRELQALWESGIDGIVIGLETGQDPGKFNELRQSIDTMVFASPRGRGKAEALLPRISSETKVVAEEEEEEEE
jgi:hypothetical protein